VILQILADARQFVHKRDLQLLQQAAVADAGELQELR
jgi:hypothetical protein